MANRGKSIEDYDQKRAFEKTPEPKATKPKAKPKSKRANKPVFVVHRHEARNLHYDLRLEAEGVLKCFAIPKGFVYDPEKKHLAVRTEDHPLRYTEFKGMIPKGEYGGGTMLIYDEGAYEICKADSLPEAIEKGEVKVFLRGRKLRGEWHLVRTNAKKDQWLMFKSKDRYARSIHDFVFQVDLAKAKKAAAFPNYSFMQPKDKAASPFSDKNWLFEMEFAGLRTMIYKEVDKIHLKIKGHEAKKSPALPHIESSIEKLRAENAVVDGVLVAVDDNNRPSRDKLEECLKNDLEQEVRGAPEPGMAAGAAVQQIVFYAFDLLYYEEWDLTSLSLRERKEVLLSILPKNNYLLYVDHIEGNGESLAEVVAAGDLKGIIAKEAQSAYRKGKSPSWLGIPNQAPPPSPSAQKAKGKDVYKALAEMPRKKGDDKVKFKNLDKIYWPASGHTKGDLLRYYQEVADLLLPYLANRPIHMLRYPDGIEGKSFYQKQVMEYTPDWIPTIEVKNKEGKEHVRYVMCNDRSTLLYLINLGSIDLHPWMSQKGSLGNPDVAFIDLDPKGAPFEHVVKLAKAIGKLLRGIGLRPYLKTSGKSGIHISIPLVGGYSYKQSRMFCEGTARVIAKEYPDIATVERSTSQRNRKVYVDFLQNVREQTIVPPYVARPVEGATVSMPLDWDELEGELHPGLFTIKNAMTRLNRTGDLFRGTLTDKQDLMPAIEKLQEYIEGL